MSTKDCNADKSREPAEAQITDDELQRIDPITTDAPNVLPCGCSREMECLRHYTGDGTTRDGGSKFAAYVDDDLLPEVGELTRVPELGERFELRGVGTVEVAMIDGNRVVCETPFEGEEYIIPVPMLWYC